MTELTKGIRMLASLMPEGEDKDNLLRAANNLAGATTDLLNAAKDGKANRTALQVIIVGSSLNRSDTEVFFKRYH